MQMHRCLDAVAAVVPRPAGDPDHLRIRRQRQGQARHGQASALHQGVGRQ
jgi:hypothetical protein